MEIALKRIELKSAALNYALDNDDREKVITNYSGQLFWQFQQNSKEPEFSSPHD